MIEYSPKFAPRRRSLGVGSTFPLWIWSIVQERNGNTIKQTYTGSVSGSELKLHVEGGRGPQDITAKKQ